jgi:hypothetical protein
MMPHSAVSFSEDSLDSTLDAADLCPRATLIATTLSEEARAEVMQEVYLLLFFESFHNLIFKTRVEVKADLSDEKDKAAKAKLVVSLS